MSTSSLPPVSSLNISCDQGRVSSSCHPSLCADCADRRKVSQLSRKGSWADQFTGLTRRVKVSRLTLAPVPQGRIFFLGCNDFGSKKYSFCQKIVIEKLYFSITFSIILTNILPCPASAPGHRLCLSSSILRPGFLYQDSPSASSSLKPCNYTVWDEAEEPNIDILQLYCR